MVERAEAEDDIGFRVEDVEDVVALKPCAGLVRLHEGEADREIAQGRGVPRGLGRQGEFLAGEVDLPKVGGLGDGGPVEADPVDEVAPPAVEDVLGEDQPMPVAQVAGQAVAEFKVFGFLRQEVLAALRAAHRVVQVGVGRHAYGAPGGGEGYCTARLVDAQGQGGFGDEAGAVRGGVHVPCGQGSGGEATELGPLPDADVQVHAAVSQRIDAAVAAAEFGQAQPVADHAFPTEVGGQEGLSPIADPAGSSPGSGDGGTVLVGALVPCGNGTVVRGEHAIGIFDIVALSLAEQLEAVAVAPVVKAGVDRPVADLMIPGDLSLPEPDFFELLGEAGRVEVLGAERGGHRAGLQVEGAPVGDRPSGVAGAGHGQVGVVAEPVCGCPADADAVAGLVLAPIVARTDAVPTIGTSFDGDSRLIRIAGSGMEDNAAGHATAAEGAAAAADDLHALDVLGIDGQVEQVVSGVGGAPADAVHPERDLLEGAAPDAEVGLGTPRASLACVDAGHGLEQSIEGRLGRAGDDLRTEGHQVAWRGGRRLIEGRLDHRLGNREGVLAKGREEWGKQKQGEGIPGRHAGQL